MNSLVFSKFYPAEITNDDVSETLSDLIEKSSKMVIATGYISYDSIVKIKSLIEKNIGIIEEVKIFVGMHYLSGFTKKQYNSCIELNEFLQDKSLGGLYVSPSINFHGKTYGFVDSHGMYTGLIGSANLSSLISEKLAYETMLIAVNNDIAKEIYDKNIVLISKLGKNINDVPAIKEEDFIKEKTDLSKIPGIEKVSDSELRKILSQSSKYIFRIPTKPEEKSHLNACYAKGRKTPDDRQWYEVEVMPSVRITMLEGYPKGKDFEVITDEGWRFKCFTGGGGETKKNLRSKDGLSKLGRALKGKLVDSGCLEVGQKVTREVLEKYGSDIIVLRSTDDPDLWILEF